MPELRVPELRELPVVLLQPLEALRVQASAARQPQPPEQQRQLPSVLR